MVKSTLSKKKYDTVDFPRVKFLIFCICKPSYMGVQFGIVMDIFVVMFIKQIS